MIKNFYFQIYIQQKCRDMSTRVKLKYVHKSTFISSQISNRSRVDKLRYINIKEYNIAMKRMKQYTGLWITPTKILLADGGWIYKTTYYIVSFT